MQGCRDPERAQAAVLRSILAKSRGCEFARRHGLCPTMDRAAYRRAVPLRRYGDLERDVDRMVAGETGVLVADRVVLFARTAGSTSRPKYLPVTRDGMQSFQRLAGLWLSLALHDHPGAARGRILAITSTTAELLPSGIPAGTTTVLRGTPARVFDGRVLTVPPSLHTPPDFAARRYAQLSWALAHDVSMIGLTAPTTLLVLFERLREWGAELVEDLARALPAVAVDPEALRARLAHLRAAVASGPLTPRRAWPNLALVGSYVEGPSRLYLPRLQELGEGLAHRNVGYAASEGRFAVPLAAGAAGGALAVSEYFFEFVAEHAEGGDDAIGVADLEIGRRYRPVVTTASGLYRYDVEDVIEVVGRFERVPLVAFCHRRATSNVAGELMTELQVVEAMRRAAARLGLSLVDFVAEARWRPPRPPYYEFAIEPVEAPADVEALSAAIESALVEMNREYGDKRRWGRLDAARARLAPQGSFLALRRERVAAGASDARFKQLHLVTRMPEPE